MLFYSFVDNKSCIKIELYEETECNRAQPFIWFSTIYVISEGASCG